MLLAAGEEGLEGLDEVDVRRYRPRGYWREAAHKRRFMEKVAAQAGVREKADWRAVTRRSIVALGGRGLLKECGGCMERLLREAFPEEEWSAADVSNKVANGHWLNKENRRAFLEEFAARHGIEGPEGWKKVSWKLLREGGGSGILTHFSSLAEALQDAFPEADFANASCRARVAPGHWKKRENCRAFLDGLAAKLGVERPEDWAYVSTAEVQQHGGSGMLAAHPSFFAALENAYEEIGGRGDIRTFRPRLPSDHWAKAGAVREFLERVGRELQVMDDEGWYRVSAVQLRQLGGSGMLFRTKSLFNALCIAYPEKTWDAARMGLGSKKSAQLHLTTSVAALFPSLRTQRQ